MLIYPRKREKLKETRTFTEEERKKKKQLHLRFLPSTSIFQGLLGDSEIVKRETLFPLDGDEKCKRKKGKIRKVGKKKVPVIDAL